MAMLIKVALFLHFREMGSNNASFTSTEVHLSLEGNEEKVVCVFSFFPIIIQIRKRKANLIIGILVLVNPSTVITYSHDCAPSFI